MIAYYVDNSIHQIPSFIYIARALGGTVFTDGADSHAILASQYADVPVEYHPSVAAVRARLAELRPEALVLPDYSRPELALPFDTAYIQVFHGTSDKTYGLKKKVRDYDFLLLPGERSRETMEKAGLLLPGRYAVVGYPKADRVFRGELPRDAAVQRLGLDPSRPVVLYAPTWRDAKQNSSLPRFGAEVLSTVPEEYSLLVKLHPNTKRYDRKYYSLIERLAAARPGIKLLGWEHDVIPAMAAADVLLTDISAVAHEFLCFDRPLVFLDPRRIPLGRDKTWVWKSGRVVKRRGEVWEAVAESLSHPKAQEDERRAARESIFHKPDGHAAERAAEAIREFLGRRSGPEAHSGGIGRGGSPAEEDVRQGEQAIWRILPEGGRTHAEDVSTVLCGPDVGVNAGGGSAGGGRHRRQPARLPRPGERRTEPLLPELGPAGRQGSLRGLPPEPRRHPRGSALR